MYILATIGALTQNPIGNFRIVNFKQDFLCPAIDPFNYFVVCIGNTCLTKDINSQRTYQTTMHTNNTEPEK